MRSARSRVLRGAIPPALAVAFAACVQTSDNPPPPLFDLGGGPDGAAGAPTPTPEAGMPGLSADPILDFGLQDCGSLPSPKAFSVRNTGSVPVSYSLALQIGTFFTLAGTTSGTLSPGSPLTVSLVPSAVPTSVTAGAVLSDAVIITTNLAGFERVTVPVTLTAQGGTLTLSPPVAGFGQIQLTSQATDIPVAIHNVGNKAVSVSIANPANTDFAVAWTGSPGAASVGPGAGLDGAVARFHPKVGGVTSEQVVIDTVGAVCQGAPLLLTLSGEGVTKNVSIAPSPLAFGPTNCGSTPAPRSVTVTNSYSFPIHITASLVKGAASPYSLPAASPIGTVPANSSLPIVVNALAIPALPASLVGGAFDDTLVISASDAPGFVPVRVGLHQQVQGGVLTVQPAPVDFHQVTQGTRATPVPITLTNTGNTPLAVSIAAPTNPDFTVAWTGSPAAVALVPNATVPGLSGTFTPSSATTENTTAKITVTSGVLCQAAPPALALTGTGNTLPISFTPPILAFKTTNCGAAAGTQTVMVNNPYPFPVVFDASLQAGGASPYVLPPSSQRVTAPPSGSIPITVNPKLVPAASSSLVANALNDALVITSSQAPGFTSGTVPLTQHASGAVLAVTMASSDFLSVATGASKALGFQVANTGNLDAPLTVVPATLKGPGTPFNALLIGAGNIVAAGNARTGSASFTPSARGTAAGTLTLTTSAALCQSAQPGVIDLSGVGVGPIASFPADPAPVDATCGSSPKQAVTYTITNSGDAPMTLSAVAAGAFVLAAASQGTLGPVAPGGTVDIVAYPKTAVIGTDRAGVSKAGSLTITTNEGGGKTYAPVSLSVVYHGANLDLVDAQTGAMLPKSISLTAPSGKCPSFTSFTIVNHGDGDATINSFGSVPNFNLSPDASFPATLAASGKGSLSFGLGPNATPGGVCSASRSLVVTTSAPAGSGICIDAGPIALSWVETGGPTNCYCS